MIDSRFPMLEALYAAGPAPDRARQMMLYGRFVGSWEGRFVYHAPDGVLREGAGVGLLGARGCGSVNRISASPGWKAAALEPRWSEVAEGTSRSHYSTHIFILIDERTGP